MKLVYVIDKMKLQATSPPTQPKKGEISKPRFDRTFLTLYWLQWCIDKLEKQFGAKSSRVLRLRGMRLEFQGQTTGDAELLTAATVVYQAVLEKDPTDSLTLKRQIAVAKAQGFRDHTIKLLVEFLTIFACDFEAWLELADLYLEQCMYQNAGFCFEELIVLQPQNYFLYVKYGEILATLGGVDNLLLARKQFSFSLELSSNNNLRAWWGLVTTANALTNCKGISAKDLKLSVDLYDLAASKISEQSKSTKNFEHVTAALQALAPSPASRTAAAAAPSPAPSASSPSVSTTTTPNASKGKKK